MVQGRHAKPRHAAILGSPVAHSLSPALHRAAYAWLGLPWTYTRHEVTEATLPGFIAGLDSTWRGLSCTMPLKSAILAWGRPDAVVRALGVANTVVFDGAPGDVEATWIRNTDVVGLREALRSAGLGRIGSARIVGSGATATSALYALSQLGLSEVQVAGRNREALTALGRRADAWGVAIEAESLTGHLSPVDVTVSTVPAPVAAHWAETLVQATGAVFDVLYDPWPTALMEAAQRRGRTLVSGLDLLAHQAVGQIQLMTGSLVPVALLRSAAETAIRGEAGGPPAGG
jgi:shikimate dehydrogenase